MNFEKVIFGFFITLAATLNFGFFIGDLSDPNQHHVAEFAAALVVSLIATVLKFGDRTQLGAVHLATSLVADLQLVSAAMVWAWASGTTGMDGHWMSLIVSLSGGALVANFLSVALMFGEIIAVRR